MFPPQRGIGTDQLAAISPQLFPRNEAAEAQRAERVEQWAGSVVPGLMRYTTEVLFHDLWLRRGLAPRDRSVVTVTPAGRTPSRQSLTQEL
jgi:4-carboxymuconolactone decarboxylase